MKEKDIVSRLDLAKEKIEFLCNYQGMKIFIKKEMRYVLKPLPNDKFEVYMIYDNRKF